MDARNPEGEIAEWNAHELMARTVIQAIQTCHNDSLSALRGRRRVEIRTWSSSLIALVELARPLITLNDDDMHKGLESKLWRIYQKTGTVLKDKLSDIGALAGLQGQVISAIQSTAFLYSFGSRTKTGNEILLNDLENLGLNVDGV